MANITKPGGSLFQPFLSNIFDVDDFFKRSNESLVTSNFPAVNIMEAEKNFVIDMAVPGFEKEDFVIKLDNDLLTISANKEDKSEKEEKNYTRKEYRQESFSRSFRLPDNVNEDRIEAAYEKGMLHLTLPKVEVAKKATQEIKVG